MITLTVHIDPAKAVQDGRTDVGSCTFSIDDGRLAELGTLQRQVLAKHLADVDAKDCTPLDHEGPSVLRGTDVAHDSVAWGSRLTAGHPPIGKIDMQTLDHLLTWRAQIMRRQYQTAQDAHDRSIRENIEAAGEVSHVEWIGLDRSGEPTVRRGRDVVRKAVDTIPIPATMAPLASAEMIEKLERAAELAREENRRRRERAIAELEEEWADWKRRDDRARAEYDDLYAQLPEVTRRRYEAGYCREDELHERLRGIACRERGLTYRAPDHGEIWDGRAMSAGHRVLPSADVESISDRQWNALEATREGLAPLFEDKEFEVIPASLTLYREDPENPDADCDGEVREDSRIALRIRWNVGSLVVTTYLPIVG